ncbi:MAG: hypothetical protein K0R18_2321 [Bacillales bacterium]|jgi:hypothetical protein|nr:hypothetical protein [Bacillales bacterium]
MPKIRTIINVEQSSLQKEHFLLEPETMVEEGNLFTGLLWGTLLSIPLWISIVGLGRFFIKVIS